jgi:hypothetical protein
MSKPSSHLSKTDAITLHYSESNPRSVLTIIDQQTWFCQTLLFIPSEIAYSGEKDEPQIFPAFLSTCKDA